MHNIEKKRIEAEQQNIERYLSQYRSGYEVLENVGDILCFLLSRLAKGKYADRRNLPKRVLYQIVL